MLKLTLRANSYTWAFLPTQGYNFSDTGSGNCHSGPADTNPGALMASTGSGSSGAPPIAGTGSMVARQAPALPHPVHSFASGER